MDTSRTTPRWRSLVAALGVGLVLAALAPVAVGAPLDDENPLMIVLDDGTTVVLLPQASTQAPSASTPPVTIAESVPADMPIMQRIGDALQKIQRPGAMAAPAPGTAVGAGAPPPPASIVGGGGAAAAAAAAPKPLMVMPMAAKFLKMVAFPTKYYYLPVNLRLSRRPDGTPEFLFLMFTTEKRVEEGGAQGALLHFLMEWGLTPEQETELKAKLKALNPRAEVAGSAQLEFEGEAPSFQIVSGTLSDTGPQGLTYSVNTSGKAPLVAGAKCAAAARLNPTGAQLLAATFQKTSSITDVSVVLNYSYTVLTPAAKGWVKIDWSKVQGEYDSLNAEYERWESGREKKSWGVIPLFGFVSSKPTYSYSYDSLRERYEFLCEKKVIDIYFEEQIADERVEKVREAFFQYFINTMCEPEGEQSPPRPPAEGEEGDDKTAPDDIRQGNHYHFNETAFKLAFERKTQLINLNYRTAVRRPLQIVANLASWYDTVRDNPRCVSSVNLNDPFFQHRDINFILDLDAKEMFDEGVNYVTVNVRKRRDRGNAFEDHVTLDANYIKQHGISAMVTYSRGEDTNPDLYEYQQQWSLRGGLVFPADPPWVQGSWEGVTLAPPVTPRLIEFEASLDDLKASDITRVTAQVHYQKFGEEVEENIHVSAGGNQPLVSKRIFMDRDARGYAYRMIFNHKTQGKLVTDWSARVSDDYIYATIPDDLLGEPKYALPAEEIARSASDKVLDRFRDLIGGD